MGMFLVGIVPAHGAELINGVAYASPQRDYKPRVNAEDRYTLGGAALGYGVASAASSNSNVRTAAALLGAMVGNNYGVYRERKLSASNRQANCRVVTAYKTNPATGQTEAQQTMGCDEVVHRDVPMATMGDPSPASYTHGSGAVVQSATSNDPLSGLTPEEKKAVEALRKEAKLREMMGEEEYTQWKASKENSEANSIALTPANPPSNEGETGTNVPEETSSAGTATAHVAVIGPGKFTGGQVVMTTTAVNVRDDEAMMIGRQAKGSAGRVIAGPASDGETLRWNVVFGYGVSGWVAEEFLSPAVIKAPDVIHEVAVPAKKSTTTVAPPVAKKEGVEWLKEEGSNALCRAKQFFNKKCE